MRIDLHLTGEVAAKRPEEEINSRSEPFHKVTRSRETESFAIMIRIHMRRASLRLRSVDKQKRKVVY